jgi:hypothetical protein
MISELAATRALFDNGAIVPGDIATCWAKTVTIDEARLKAKKGSFSISIDRNAFRDRILFKGYQSKISRTTGRVTAMGLLNKARTKKARVSRYCLFDRNDNGFLEAVSLSSLRT